MIINLLPTLLQNKTVQIYIFTIQLICFGDGGNITFDDRVHLCESPDEEISWIIRFRTVETHTENKFALN